MQFLSTVSRESASSSREASVSAHLPFARHVDDHTIVTRDGLLLQIIELRGLLFETADAEELNYRTQLRDAMLRSIGSSHYALYHHLFRRRADLSLEGDFPDSFSADLDRRWHERLGSRQLFVNELFLTLVRRPLGGGVGRAERLRNLFVSGGADRTVALTAELRQMNATREALFAALSAYDPRLLGVYSTQHGPASELLEMLGHLLNGDPSPVLLPRQELRSYLPRRRISFGDDTVELAQAGHLPRQFVAMISVKDYPGHSVPGMFDDLHRLPIDLTITHSFGFIDRQAALGRINLVLRRMRSTEDEAVSLRDELSIAKDNVAAGRAAFGEHHATIAVKAESLSDLDAAVAEVTALLADQGIMAVREDIGTEPAFWAQFPGNFKYIARRATLSSANFAGLASLHNFPAGYPTGNHWGDAVTLLETTAAGPYYFNFHHGDLGNFTVIGPSGSGKTVVLNFLLAQARRFGPKIIFFDKDRGAELFIRAIGGRYDRLRPGEPSGLNPLQLSDTAANRAFLLDWLTLLVGGVTSADETLRLKDAIDANYGQPAEHRRLRFLAELLRGYDRPTATDLWSRLRAWWGDGERAWLFDNADDRIDLSADTIGFDMTAILDNPTTRTPSMLYLFHRVEERLTGDPAIIVVDEGWKALDDEVFVRFIRDWQKTIRKRNGIVGFATQSASDALESRIASAIIEQAATQIFMVNPKAAASDYIDGFGLTPHEFDLIRSMPDDRHCFLIKSGGDSVVARLDLSQERELLTILSGRESTVRRFDELAATVGEDPRDWLPLLVGSRP